MQSRRTRQSAAPATGRRYAWFTKPTGEIEWDGCPALGRFAEYENLCNRAAQVEFKTAPTCALSSLASNEGAGCSMVGSDWTARPRSLLVRWNAAANSVEWTRGRSTEYVYAASNEVRCWHFRNNCQNPQHRSRSAQLQCRVAWYDNQNNMNGPDGQKNTRFFVILQNHTYPSADISRMVYVKSEQWPLSKMTKQMGISKPVVLSLLVSPLPFFAHPLASSRTPGFINPCSASN